MDISVSLIELLRLHDCVIIPELGGFIANYRPAEADLVVNKFSPPKKEIVFSSKLNKNDGLLVNHISETNGLGYMETRKMVSEFTDEAWSKLENGETLEFPKIGSLHFDKNEKLIFEPSVNENLLLETYGMEGFHFPELSRNETISTKKVFRDKEAVRPIFSSRTVKRALIAIPILIALALIPVSKMYVKNGIVVNQQVSGTVELPMSETPKATIPATTTFTEETNNSGNTASDSNLKEAIVAESKSEMPKIETTVPVTTPTKGKYHLIGGCFRNRENADNLILAFKSKGFQPEIETLSSGAFMVTIQSYDEREDALITLDSLQKAEPNAGYWMTVK